MVNTVLFTNIAGILTGIQENVTRKRDKEGVNGRGKEKGRNCHRDNEANCEKDFHNCQMLMDN